MLSNYLTSMARLTSVPSGHVTCEKHSIHQQTSTKLVFQYLKNVKDATNSLNAAENIGSCYLIVSLHILWLPCDLSNIHKAFYRKTHQRKRSCIECISEILIYINRDTVTTVSVLCNEETSL